MERQKAKARASWSGSGDTKTENYWFPLREKYGATEFLGYDTEISEGVVQTIIRGGPEVSELRAGESGEVVVNQTPFYAESGGQVGDTGWLKRTSDGEIVADVLTTHKQAGDLFIHNVKVKSGVLKVGDSVRLEVDHGRRSSIRAHHSATHLLHEALRQVLGDHIAQRGSLVAPDRLRFDFVHPKPITADELSRIEDIANDVVLENAEVTTRLMAVDDARDAGARALFGEKYGDEVRVVSMGKSAREHGSNALGWSVELCGGTHVRRTGDIGLISVTGESAVASGVRRIEALTGNHARKHANDTMQLARTAASELRTTLEDMPARIASLMEERKKLERDLAEARKKLAMGGGGSAANGSAASAAGVREVGNVKLMARAVEGIEMKDLKSLADEGKKQLGSGVVAIVGVTGDGKAGVVVGVTSDLTSRYNAVDLARVASEALGGKGGGGRPDMAQAGGPDGAKANAALSAIEKAMASA
jgi:alanyl-tRNA synthetase